MNHCAKTPKTGAVYCQPYRFLVGNSLLTPPNCSRTVAPYSVHVSIIVLIVLRFGGGRLCRGQGRSFMWRFRALMVGRTGADTCMASAPMRGKQIAVEEATGSGDVGSTGERD
jgi:hypothetical protein